jgi:O-antigen/teichoic acid export membrane protein
LAVCINLDILKYLIAPGYWQGLPIVPILLLAYLFLVVYYNISVWFKLTDKTYYGTWITVGGAIITMVANYVLIPVLGYTGSAWAAFACYASMMIACYFFGQKFYPIPYQILPSISYVLLTLVLIYFINAMPIQNQWVATAFHGVILALIAGVIYLLEKKSFQRT